MRCLGSSAPCPARIGNPHANNPPASAPRARTAHPRRHPTREQPARVGAPRTNSQRSLLPRPLSTVRSQRCLDPSLAASAPRYLGLSAPLGPSAPCAANTLPRPLGTPAASAPRPRAQQHASSAPRPQAQQAARCLGPSATCAANTLHAASAFGPKHDFLGHSLSETSSTRADLMRCLGSSASCAASSPLPRPLGPVRSNTLPRPLGTMRSKHAARCLGSSAPCAACPPDLSPRPAPCHSAAWPSQPRLRGLPACVVLLGSSALRLPRPRLRGLPACVVLLGFTPPETTPAR
ncbi:unnamed protein product, partial [Musa hybrid cultivar]